MVVAAGSWFFGMLLCALPYYLSGNYLSYLDCCFDVMSGLTTTGLVLIQDLDHIANGLNMWRHLLTFIGGQGMVVLALSFLVKGANGAYKMYVGEGKDERLMPNAVSTARYIWLISLIYLAVGTLVLWGAGIGAGLSVDRAFLHGCEAVLRLFQPGFVDICGNHLRRFQIGGVLQQEDFLVANVEHAANGHNREYGNCW